MAIFTDASSTSWVERSTGIKLTLGEFYVGTANFRAAVFRDVDWRSSGPIGVDEIRKRLESGVEAVYLSSQPTTEQLPPMSFLKFGIRYVPAHFSRSCVEIRGTFQDYVKGFSARNRNNLTRRVRRFAQLSGGTTVFCEYRRPSEIATFYELASKITCKTYQHKLLHSSLPQTAEFRGKLLALAARDELLAYILFYDSAPIAFQYSTIRGDVLTGQITGYDPDYRQHSPGFVLHYCIFDRLFSEGHFRLFDFGTGDADYKRFFATESVDCAAVYYFAYTLKNVSFLMLHGILRVVSAGTVRLLSELSLRDSVKRTLRKFWRSDA